MRRRMHSGGGSMALFTGEGYAAAPMAFPQSGLLLRGRRGTGNSPRGSSEGGDDRKPARDRSRLLQTLAPVGESSKG
jgi:hypothetical protein